METNDNRIGCVDYHAQCGCDCEPNKCAHTTKEESDTLKDIPKVEDFKCPNCGRWSDHEGVISKTPVEFIEEPDPHYSWEETHKCNGCGTVYRFQNGT